MPAGGGLGQVPSNRRPICGGAGRSAFDSRPPTRQPRDLYAGAKCALSQFARQRISILVAAYNDLSRALDPADQPALDRLHETLAEARGK